MTNDPIRSTLHVGGYVLDAEMHEWWEGFGRAKYRRCVTDCWLPGGQGTPRTYLGSIHTTGKRGRIRKAWTCRATTPRGVERIEGANVAFLLPLIDGSAE